jgi:glycosyltransferase involved in cell wall biosynthesis
MSRWAGRLRRWLGERIVATGLWEVLFPVRPSRRLLEFVEEFRPDVIYCTGYSLAFATLPVLLARKFGLPICFQTTEDWPLYTYAGSPVGILVRRQAARLVRASALRLAFGRKMKEEFEARYGVPFQETWHLDDAGRFGPPGPEPSGPVRRVVFTGSMVLNRHEPVEDMLAAIRVLRREGLAVELDVYCTGVPRELGAEVRGAPEVRFLPLPPHDGLGPVLRGADVLFLPEAFSVGADRLGLAISTKCHLYMMAGRPVLAYGPAHAGTMEYARKDGWALVVEERSVDRLAGALRTLLLDPAARARLTHQAGLCFIRNHDAGSARERFERSMAALATRRAGNTQRERIEEKT